MSQSQDDQLIELLLHLRRTTPDQARQVLNAQPQLSYLLIQLMVKMNAINLEILQKTLASYIPGTVQPAAAPAPPAAPSIPPSAIPPHVASSSQYRTATPPNAPTGPAGYPSASPSGYPSYASAPPSNPYGPPGHAAGGPPPGFQQTPPPSAPASSLTADALAAMPEQQKAMITRIITMTPESIRALPPHERDTINQIRATLGLPTG